MGALSRSWDLVGQSFGVLKSDKELMWLPVVSAIFCLAATVVIFSAGLLLLVPLGSNSPRCCSAKVARPGDVALRFSFLRCYLQYSDISCSGFRLFAHAAALGFIIQPR